MKSAPRNDKIHENCASVSKYIDSGKGRPTPSLAAFFTFLFFLRVRLSRGSFLRDRVKYFIVIYY